MLDCGAIPHQKTLHGMNVLHIAALNDKATSIYYFYKLGLDVSLVDLDGNTPLHLAAKNNNLTSIEYLLGDMSVLPSLVDK